MIRIQAKSQALGLVFCLRGFENNLRRLCAGRREVWSAAAHETKARHGSAMAGKDLRGMLLPLIQGVDSP